MQADYLPEEVPNPEAYRVAYRIKGKFDIPRLRQKLMRSTLRFD